jgi:hypothetical protein
LSRFKKIRILKKIEGMNTVVDKKKTGKGNPTSDGHPKERYLFWF